VDWRLGLLRSIMRMLPLIYLFTAILAYNHQKGEMEAGFHNWAHSKAPWYPLGRLWLREPFAVQTLAAIFRSGIS
jgi:hypothetical protein